MTGTPRLATEAPARRTRNNRTTHAGGRRGHDRWRTPWPTRSASTPATSQRIWERSETLRRYDSRGPARSPIWRLLAERPRGRGRRAVINFRLAGTAGLLVELGTRTRRRRGRRAHSAPEAWTAPSSARRPAARSRTADAAAAPLVPADGEVTAPRRRLLVRGQVLFRLAHELPSSTRRPRSTSPVSAAGRGLPPSRHRAIGQKTTTIRTASSRRPRIGAGADPEPRATEAILARQGPGGGHRGGRRPQATVLHESARHASQASPGRAARLRALGGDVRTTAQARARAPPTPHVTFWGCAARTSAATQHLQPAQ